MAVPFRLRSQVGIQAPLNLREGLHIGAEGKCVSMVMPPTVFRNVFTPGGHATDARDFVRGNGNPDAAAASEDAQRTDFGGNCAAHRRGVVGIVDAVEAITAMVNASMALRF